MKRILFVVVAALALNACRGLERLTGIERTTTATREGSTQAKPVFLLAGQSNMVRFSQFAVDAFRADYAAKHGGEVPGVVPCAVGGTYSGQWLPDGELFNGCLDAARGQIITGILYYQGESDAYLETTNWGDRFGQTVAGFREHFGAVPVVFAQIATSTDPDFLRGWSSIQAQQAAVCIPGVRMIHTEDVAALVDTVHLTPESLQRIAARFVDALE